MGWGASSCAPWGPPTLEVFPRPSFLQSPPSADTFTSAHPHPPASPWALAAPPSCLKGASAYMHRLPPLAVVLGGKKRLLCSEGKLLGWGLAFWGVGTPCPPSGPASPFFRFTGDHMLPHSLTR